MDLLHGGALDGFCLVSSDSDFTRLATRIREAGLSVYGFGERKTPKPFVAACDKFIFTEILQAPLAGSVQLPATGKGTVIIIIEEGLSYEQYTQTVEPNARPIILQPDDDLTINYLETHGLPLTAEHLFSDGARRYDRWSH